MEFFYAALKEMPVPLVDYLSTKHFGMSVDLDKQQSCIDASVEHCESLVDRANYVLAELIRMRDVFEQEQRSQPLPRLEYQFGCGGIFCVLVILIGLAVCLTAVFNEPPADEMDSRAVERANRHMRDNILAGLGIAAFGAGVIVYHRVQFNRANRARGYK